MSKDKSLRAYLQDIVSYLDKAVLFTQEGQTAFMTNEMAQLAVIRVYEVVGEIVKRLPTDYRESVSHVDWRKLAGFRDFLTHNYDEIILSFVWQAIEDIPNLRAAIQVLIDQLPSEDEII
jgi:uncharacterized protein with HEPN domain